MKLAIIGAGLVAKTYHIPAFLRCENVKITAVCDVYEPAAIAMAEPPGGKGLYGLPGAFEGSGGGYGFDLHPDGHPLRDGVGRGGSGKNIFSGKAHGDE